MNKLLIVVPATIILVAMAFSISGYINSIKGPQGGTGSGTLNNPPTSSDGGISGSKSDHMCQYCTGSGKCYQCHGQGYTLNTNGSERSDCIFCGGNRKCPICHGTGRNS